ncbi:MAG: type II secretion system F family protein [Candidatus Nanohaloarchaea archaeon]|nr:type II secretion system F family protein [Candidatus Nanohaloarchaea archaeon]
MDANLDLAGWIEDLSTRQKVEIASFGAGGFILLAGIFMYSSGTRTIGGSLFVAGMVTAFLPYGLFVYFQERKYEDMEKNLPLFLRNISEGVKGGMSLPQAFQNATQTDYGRLNEEVDRAAHQLSWGVPFPEVMRRMSRRMGGSGLIRRSIAIILQAYESGGDIAQTLDSIAANASRIKEAEEKRKSVLMQQVYIIYAIHLLFLGIIIALYVLLGKFLLTIGGSSASGLGFGEVENFCRTGIAGPICTLCPAFGMGSATSTICYYKSLFLLMVVIEGVFNGLVIGEVTKGKVASGIKHSLAMSVVGFVVYIAAVTLL